MLLFFSVCIVRGRRDHVQPMQRVAQRNKVSGERNENWTSCRGRHCPSVVNLPNILHPSVSQEENQDLQEREDGGPHPAKKLS